MFMDPSAQDLPLPVDPWPLTAQEISTREAEIILLEELEEGDDNIHKHKFRDLWYSERGPETETKLLQIWREIGHPDTWSQAEESLEQLIRKDPTFLHSFHLLAKLYCLQGRFEESYKLCESILALKPYHFMTLETMAANCFALKIEWTGKRLPSPSDPTARRAWVEQAVKDARQMLTAARNANVPKQMDEGIQVERQDSWQ